MGAAQTKGQAIAAKVRGLDEGQTSNLAFAIDDALEDNAHAEREKAAEIAIKFREWIIAAAIRAGG